MSATEAQYGLDAFKRSLATGSGLAAVILQQGPFTEDHFEALKLAAFTDQRFDQQSEDDRSDYLWRLINLTPFADRIDTAIKDNLAQLTGGERIEDVSQQFHILCLFAKEHADFDASFLTNFLMNPQNRNFAVACSYGYVALMGLDGFVRIVELLATELADNLAHEHGWHMAGLIRTLADQIGENATFTGSRDARMQSATLHRLMQAFENLPPDFQLPPSPSNYTAALASAQERKYFSIGWIIAATGDDLAQAAEDLVKQRDAEWILAYLRIFQRRPFPLSAAHLVPFLHRADVRVQHAAANALAKIDDQGTKELARAWLRKGERIADALTLLRSSLTVTDIQLAAEAVEFITVDDDEWHAIGSEILRLSRGSDDEAIAVRPALLRLYRSNPCSFCRNSIVEQLATMEALPQWIAEECRFDAVAETVMLAVDRLHYLRPV